MRIGFMCASAEVGRDGVGDYTRRLATELVADGHSSALVAIRERSAFVPTAGPRASDGGALPVLRLGSNVPLRAAIDDVRLRTWISDLKPEVLSLQLVPWSFGARGILPRRLASQLLGLTDDASRHVMVHEPWVTGPESIKQRVLSRMQRHAFRRFFAEYAPDLVTVSNEYYVECLADIDVAAQVLPLFSNIDVRSGGAASTQRSVLLFGSLPEGRARQRLLDELFDASALDSFELTLIGQDAQTQDAFLREWRSRAAPLVSVRAHPGPLDTAVVSRHLAAGAVGYVRTPHHLIGKSGVAHAFSEHGLALWAPEVDADIPFSAPIEFQSHLRTRLRDALSLGRRPPTFDAVSAVAERFVHQLRQARASDD